MKPQSGPATSEEHALRDRQAALFSQLVTGHGQMALMFLGKLPNPQTGNVEMPILEAARTFMDQLEMLQEKTQGNISADEIRVLEKTLSTTRTAFVEVVAALNRGDADAFQPAIE
ncbi:MAG: DUF1844 domain-containing protein [Pedosphaera sp.]|nr:DUF1844 domain-containing protein [Pedosphaera sp.]